MSPHLQPLKSSMLFGWRNDPVSCCHADLSGARRQDKGMRKAQTDRKLNSSINGKRSNHCSSNPWEGQQLLWRLRLCAFTLASARRTHTHGATNILVILSSLCIHKKCHTGDKSSEFAVDSTCLSHWMTTVERLCTASCAILCCGCSQETDVMKQLHLFYPTTVTEDWIDQNI